MNRRNERTSYSLNATGIDSFAEYLEKTLEAINIERQNRLRVRLSLEEALLRFRDHFGDGKCFQVLIARRFGKPFIQIELEGDVYNPLSKLEDDLDDWSSSLLVDGGMNPKFSYTGNTNILRVTIPTPGVNPVLKILIALGLGLLAGVLIPLISPGIADATEPFYEPIYELWFRLLNLISGPVIFFMVVAAILGLERMTGKGTKSWYVVGRYFLITLVITTFTVVITCLLVKVNILGNSLNGDVLATVLDDIFNVIPNDFLKPFMTAETPQLILLGFALGTMLIILRDRVSGLVKIVQQINNVCLLMAEWISWLVPIFAGVFIFLEITRGKTNLLVALWRPFLIAFVLAVFVVAVFVFYISARKKIPVRVLMSKIWNPFLLTVFTGSLNSSYGLTEKYCTRYMGIDHDFTEVSLSHGLVLYMPINILGAVAFTIIAAAEYGISVSWLWFIMTIILIIILMEAAPPVPGVSLLVYIAVFSQLGIPNEVLIPAMIFDIVFGIFSTAANQLMLQLEMILQADRMGLINKNRLQNSVQTDASDKVRFRHRNN